MLLLVCGYATSWIIDNLLDDRGGFFNRVTMQIHLAPFTLAESEQLLRANGVELSRQQVIECFMVFGGIPHYLNLIDRRSSLAQNIDQLCFDPHGGLRFELDRLTAALFKHSAIHEAILRSLSETGVGRTLRNKLDAFATEAKPGKTLHLTLVSLNGVVRNAHAGILTNEIIADDLFS